jgi:hypothetical protein
MNSQKEIKLGRMISCGPERPKQAPATMLPDEKQFCHGTQIRGTPSLLPTSPHPPSRQVSLSSLHCFLKNGPYFSDIPYIPQFNNNTVTDMLSVKLSGDKIQKAEKVSAVNLKEFLKLKETRPDTAISVFKIF